MILQVKREMKIIEKSNSVLNLILKKKYIFMKLIRMIL